MTILEYIEMILAGAVFFFGPLLLLFVLGRIGYYVLHFFSWLSFQLSWLRLSDDEFKAAHDHYSSYGLLPKDGEE